MLQSEGTAQYLARVRRALPCRGPQKRYLLRKIREQLAAWEESCPSATYENAAERFGQPEQIAAAYVESADTEELLSGLRISGRIVRAVAAMALGIVLIWAVGVAASVVDSHNSADGHSIETVVVTERNEDSQMPEGVGAK